MHSYTGPTNWNNKIYFGLSFISITLGNLINTHVAIISISAMLIFTGIYFLFANWGWKLFKGILKLPDLNGVWKCTGSSNNIELEKAFIWYSEITIKQKWNTISIHSKTEKSSSNSTVASIEYHEATKSYKLSYSYKNDTNNYADDGMLDHNGYCVLTFKKKDKQLCAEGFYFNDIRTRKTNGTMVVNRKSEANSCN